jgi:hypothetical protein
MVLPDVTMPLAEVVVVVVGTMMIDVHHQHHIIPMTLVVAEEVVVVVDTPRLPWTIIIDVHLLLRCALGRGLEVRSDRIRVDILVVHLHRRPAPAVLDTMTIGIIIILLHEAIRMLEVIAIIDPIAVSVLQDEEDAVQVPIIITGAVVALTGIVVIADRKDKESKKQTKMKGENHLFIGLGWDLSGFCDAIPTQRNAKWVLSDI